MKRWVLNNIWLKLFSLVLAVFLWFYINSEISKVIIQKTYEDIPVRLVANWEKLLLANYQITISPKTIDVLLRSERHQIEKVEKTDIKALIDISDISDVSGEHNLPVKILLPENIEAIKKQTYPSSCQVVISGFKLPSE